MATIYLGTSGWQYPEWRGRRKFYPEKLPAKRMLEHYGERLRSVEVNSTFRGLPTAESLDAWAAAVPGDFRFALKAPQYVTHICRLAEKSDATVTALFEVAARLGERLGPVLFQLPPNFKRALDRLERFLGILPRNQRVAFEFRHESWFVPEVLDALRERGAALCVAEHESGFKTPVAVTASFAYLRLHRERYAFEELRSWAARFAGWRDEGRDVFCYFKHEERARAPRYALAIEAALADRASP